MEQMRWHGISSCIQAACRHSLKLQHALQDLLHTKRYTAYLQLIQRRCPRCSGSGLVERGPFLRKCPECGGFFPWQGWKQFLKSTAAPGNGGVLRQPRNQDGVIYRHALYAFSVFLL